MAGTDDATRLSPGSVGAGPGRTASTGSTRPPSSGWLTGSDSIDHGRFGPGTLPRDVANFVLQRMIERRKKEGRSG